MKKQSKTASCDTNLSQMLGRFLKNDECIDGKFVLYENSTRPQGFKTFFMLNSTEHEISTAYKN